MNLGLPARTLTMALESEDSGKHQESHESTSPISTTDKAKIIVGMKELSTSEVEKLTTAGIRSADDFWAFIGSDSSSGISLLATKANINQTRILEIAGAQALRECDGQRLPWPQRLWRTLRDHWLDIVLITGICFLAVLISRAFGLFDGISGPIGLRGSVIVSPTNIQKGVKLQPENLSRARLIPRSNDFTEVDQLRGLIAAQDIQAGDPLRFEQVLRLQLVAAADLPVGAIITKDVVSLAWSSYEPDATANLDELLGHEVTRTFKTGDPIPRFLTK